MSLARTSSKYLSTHKRGSLFLDCFSLSSKNCHMRISRLASAKSAGTGSAGCWPPDGSTPGTAAAVDGSRVASASTNSFSVTFLLLGKRLALVFGGRTSFQLSSPAQDNAKRECSQLPLMQKTPQPKQTQARWFLAAGTCGDMILTQIGCSKSAAK